MRKIDSNIRNMRQCIDERLSRYKQNQIHVEKTGGKRLKTYELMDQHEERERFKRKICDVVSVHKQIVEKDEEIEAKLNNPSLMMDIKLEMESKLKTKYLSCVEIVLFSKLSTTIWDDSVIIPWENLEKFFGFFGHNFDTYEYLKRGSFSKKEAFLIFLLEFQNQLQKIVLPKKIKDFLVCTDSSILGAKFGKLSFFVFMKKKQHTVDI